MNPEIPSSITALATFFLAVATFYLARYTKVLANQNKSMIESYAALNALTKQLVEAAERQERLARRMAFVERLREAISLADGLRQTSMDEFVRQMQSGDISKAGRKIKDLVLFADFIPGKYTQNKLLYLAGLVDAIERGGQDTSSSQGVKNLKEAYRDVVGQLDIYIIKQWQARLNNNIFGFDLDPIREDDLLELPSR